MRKKNNRGFSLIELVAGLAIFSVVGAAVVGFMSIGSKTYVNVNKEVNIQYESQLAVNQIKDLIIDANRGVSYCLVSVDGTYKATDPQNPNSETEILNDFYATNPDNTGKVKRCLLVYNEEEISPAVYNYPVMKIVWDPQTEKISYTENTYPDLATLDADKYLESIPATAYHLLAEYVTEFSIDLKNIEKKQVDMSALFATAGRTYKTTPTIALRNKVIASDNLKNIYNKPSIPKDTLALRVIIKKNGIPIEVDNLTVGDVADYEAEVEMQAGATPDNSVTWYLEDSVVDAGKTPSTVDQTGKVTISLDEKNPVLRLKAVSPKLPSKPAYVTINVTIIDMTKGYVTRVELGELNPIDKLRGVYRFEFEDTEKYITYMNESKVTPAQRGVRFTCSTAAPTGSYMWDSTTGSLTAKKESAGHKFAITATAKLTKPDGVNYASDTKEFTVEAVEKNDPDVEIKDDTGLSRGGSMKPTVDVKNLNSPEYKWELVGGKGFSSDDDWTDGYFMRKDWISIANANTKTPTITIDHRLDWTTEFEITLRLTVTGYDTDGKKVTVKAEDQVFKLPPVTYSLIPQKNTTLTYGYNDTQNKGIQVVFNNIIICGKDVCGDGFNANVIITNLYRRNSQKPISLVGKGYFQLEGKDAWGTTVNYSTTVHQLDKNKVVRLEPPQYDTNGMFSSRQKKRYDRVEIDFEFTDLSRKKPIKREGDPITYTFHYEDGK